MTLEFSLVAREIGKSVTIVMYSVEFVLKEVLYL